MLRLLDKWAIAIESFFSRKVEPFQNRLFAYLQKSYREKPFILFASIWVLVFLIFVGIFLVIAIPAWYYDRRKLDGLMMREPARSPQADIVHVPYYWMESWELAHKEHHDWQKEGF
jgi:heme/copper-type cytochrome/quinol oxidase subunit 2